MARWIRAADCRQLRERQRVLCEVEGQRLALFLLNGRFVAIDNHCPHQQGPIGAGQLEGSQLTCPWHGRTFDLLSGQCTEPGQAGLRHYDVRQQDEDLLVDLDSNRPVEAPSQDICCYLVRYGAIGHVGRFGSIRPLDVDRGDRVVLHTDRGLEVGTVLVAQEERTLSNRSPAGELLRVLTDSDRRQWQEQGNLDPGLLDDCRRLLASAGATITVVDAEVLFDGQTVLVYHLGSPSVQLGPVAARLAERWAPLRVRFELAGSAEASPLSSNPVAPSAASALAGRPLGDGGSALAASGSEGREPGTGEPEARLPEARLPEARLPEASEPDAERLTFVERCKRESRNLRGSLADEVGGKVERFSRESAELLQFHGIYQQRLRPATDSPTAALPATREPSSDVARAAGRTWQFMVRIKADGGRLSASQLLAILQLADQFGTDAARITSRQAIQVHGVARGNLRRTIRHAHDHLLTTFGACGDVNRNVMCCPAPLGDGVRQKMQATAGQLARHLTPRSSAWFDIWIDDDDGSSELAASHAAHAGHAEEPVYGRSYLPRKMKVAIGLAEDNCVDLFTQDIGLMGVVERQGGLARLLGYNLLVGGGLGVTAANANANMKTFPRLADPLAYCDYGDVLQGVGAIVELYRDHGPRQDRRRARLKYLLHDWGLDRFRETLSGYLPPSLLLPPRDVRVTGCDDHLGWHAQGDGCWFLGLHVPDGRLRDVGSRRLKRFLVETLQRFKFMVRLTAQQNLLLCNVSGPQRAELEAGMAEHGLVSADLLPPLLRQAMACPALPTCGLAITEAERLLPGLLDRLLGELQPLGLAQQSLSIRMTGCPNGCVRTATSEIGLVGQAPGRYQVLVGGSWRGDRLGFAVGTSVSAEELVPRLRRLLVCYRTHRESEESLGDFCVRWGAARLTPLLDDDLDERC